jgi:hypothetical protein
MEGTRKDEIGRMMVSEWKREQSLFRAGVDALQHAAVGVVSVLMENQTLRSFTMTSKRLDAPPPRHDDAGPAS